MDKESLTEEEQQLALADRLSRVILSTRDISEIYERFASELRELLPMDWAAVALIDEPAERIHLSPLSAQINSSLDLGESILFPGTPVEWIARNKCAMLEPDLAEESQFRTGVFFRRQGVRAVVYMPLFSRGEVLGGLIVGCRKPNAYGERELKLLKYSASQLALPVANSLLFQTVQRLALIYALVRHFRLGEGFKIFCQELRKQVPFDSCSISMVEGERARILSLFSTAKTHLSAGDTFPLEDTTVAWVVKNKKSYIVSDFSPERHFPSDEIHLKEGMRSEICVPIVWEGEVFATLYLASLQPGAYKEREKDFLEELAKHLAPILGSLKSRVLVPEAAAWLSTIVEDFRTPLTPMVASSSLLAEQLQADPESAEARLSQNICRGAQELQARLSKLTEAGKTR